jgi:DNA repair exonuclease SbcCD ATPase subunit
MRITRLRLTDFKSHESLEIEPAGGLTIIRGPNEAGKSTIQQAIELAFFRKADANREDIRQAWTWGSGAPPAVELEFEVDGTTGAIHKRFGGAHSEAQLTVGPRTITDYTLIGDELASLLGIPTEAFFRATASVGHSELDAVSGDESAIGDRLQTAISGADRGTAKAKKKLETAVRRYRTEGHKNPGLLKVVRAEMVMLENELATGEGALSGLQADRAQWVEAHERREALDVQLVRQQAELEEAQRAQVLGQRREAAQDRYDRLRRAVDLTEERERLQRALPSALPLPQLRSAVSRARSLEYEISELDAEISVAANNDTASDADIVPPRPLRWLGLAVALVALGWVVMSLLPDVGLAGTPIMLVLAIGVAAALIQGVRLASRRRQSGLAMQLALSAQAQRVDQERARQDQLRRAHRELESTLEQLGVDDVEAAEAMLETAQQQTEALAQIEGELRGLGVDEGNPRRLEEARDQAANETEQARHALAAMGASARDPAAALAAARRQVAQTVPARDKARSEEDQAQGRIDANQVDAELVAELSERLASAAEREAELRRRVQVYEGTLSAIEAAERATLKTAARYLEEHMGPTISAVTDGRYDDIEVDEQSLAFKVRAPETGEPVEVGQLSQGTADQLFLAARLGLVRLVTLDRRPPLILDDPFVTFDSARAERAVRLVRGFAHEQGFQVLLLTCSDRFDPLADKLIVLPGPSKERVLAMPRKAADPSPPAKVDGPQPTLRFAPDPRPNPDPVAPRRSGAPDQAAPGQTPEPRPAPAPQPGSKPVVARPAQAEDTEPDPLAALREAARAASDKEHDTGVADPFRLSGGDGSGAAD